MTKKNCLLMGISLCAFTALGAETDKIDAGGVSVDLSKPPAEQPNLLKFSDFEDTKTDLQQKPFGNWGSSFYAHGKSSEELKSKMQALTFRKISTDNPAS
ncbi:MAG: hypothetical protein WC071_03325, partial [Victivallaceae bacterium]